MMKTRKMLQSGLLLALAGAPASVFACATCHGESDSPLAHGMNAGIFTLMGVIVTVLAGIALFFVHVVRREEAQITPPPRNPVEP